MTETEKRVYDEIKKDNYIRANQISERIDKSEKTIYRAIKKLKDKKYISRIGDDYSGYWQVL